MLGEHIIHNRLQPVSNSDIENVISRGPNQLRGHYLMLGYIMQCDLRWSSLFFRFKESAIHSCQNLLEHALEMCNEELGN